MVILYHELHILGATMEVDFNTDGSIVYFIFHKWDENDRVSIHIDNIRLHPEEIENILIRYLKSFVGVYIRE